MTELDNVSLYLYSMSSKGLILKKSYLVLGKVYLKTVKKMLH